MKLLLYIYNILLIILTPFAMVIGYFIMKKKKKADFWLERFGFIPIKAGKCKYSVWFHCASVGEVRSIKNIVEKLRKENKDIFIIVSTMTVTGKKEAIDFIKADTAFLIPIENPPAVSHIIKTMNTKIMVIVDTEIWPNLIYTASKYTTLILINGRISDKTFKTYKKLSFIFKHILKRFSAIMTKSEEDEKRFIEITGNDKNIISIGNIKFQERKNKDNIPLINELKNIKFFLAASTHNNEEETILSWFNNSTYSFDKIVIAPRHIERSENIKNMALNLGYSVSLLSENNFSSKIIIIDAFGKLEGLYILADKIFIGGSLINIGGHNIYEALQFKKDVAVGKYMFSFKEIFEDGLKYNIITEINNKNDWDLWINAEKKDMDNNFIDFFAEIDKKNNNTLNSITDLINSVITCNREIK